MANGDAFAGLFVGGFLIAAVAQGKSKELIDLSKDSGGFLIWGSSVLITEYVISFPALSEIAPAIRALIFAAAFLVAGPKFFSSIEELKRGF